MEILFCFDEQYEQHFGVAVTSLILNNLEHVKQVHIITNKINSNLHHKLEQLKAKCDVNFLIYQIDDASVKNLKLSYHISSASYYRLLAADLLPSHLSKVLYLDSDLIVNGSLLELYNYDLSNYIIAAYSGLAKAVATKKRLQLQSDYYFNAGVMLINLDAWRKIDVGSKCLDLIRNQPDLVLLLDQDALNKVIDGQFLNLDNKWNSLVNLYAGESAINEESIIVHFVGSLKPWHSWCIAAEKKIYWLYLQQSPWSSAYPELPNNFKTFLSAIKALIQQIKLKKLKS
ncbi:glycosyl transferase family 8 [Calothrix sp. NIES-2100]|uniref:glycosyltransferase family 8 protein n=1 Tax=Calothrix sp. NIES-2100 TaxID=1954172 RepID=UPI000B5EA73A|nr:glycosyl transferase family 8 [Calothrix sp. NIES-2100]